MSHTPNPIRACTAADHCITCSDEGVPMRVVGADAGSDIATCADADDRRVDVMLGLVGPVALGDMLLVHAGTALLRLERTVGGTA